MVLSFLFGEISIQIIPDKDICLILKAGNTIWAGNRVQLEKLLNNVYGL